MHLGILKERQCLTFAYAVNAERIQRSFMIARKESGWLVLGLEVLLTRYKGYAGVIEFWLTEVYYSMCCQ